jgi:hypothetical protein
MAEAAAAISALLRLPGRPFVAPALAPRPRPLGRFSDGAVSATPLVSRGLTLGGRPPRFFIGGASPLLSEAESVGENAAPLAAVSPAFAVAVAVFPDRLGAWVAVFLVALGAMFVLQL